MIIEQILDTIVDIVATRMEARGIEIDKAKLKDRMLKGGHVLNLLELRKGNLKTLEEVLGVNSMEEAKKLLEKEPKEEDGKE